MILDDFFDAAAAFDTDTLARVLHPDARFSEMPNVINPAGTERDADGRARRSRGHELLAEQTYDVHSMLAAGDKIAARATWRGTLAATGRS